MRSKNMFGRSIKRGLPIFQFTLTHCHFLYLNNGFFVKLHTDVYIMFLFKVCSIYYTTSCTVEGLPKVPVKNIYKTMELCTFI